MDETRWVSLAHVTLSSCLRLTRRPMSRPKLTKCFTCITIESGFIFLAVFVLNFAFVFATVAIVERIENYDDGNGESAQGLLSGIIGTADDRNSSSTQAKAAVLSGLLTTLPAIVGALYAMKLIRKDAANTKRSCTEDQGTREARRLDEVVIVV